MYIFFKNQLCELEKEFLQLISKLISEPVALISDNSNNQVIAFNPRTMKVMARIPTEGSGPYPIDRSGTNHVYVTTRGSKSLDVIDNKKLQRILTIPLEHYPRSVTCNKISTLCVVSGRKAPVSSVIETESHEVVAKVGSSNNTTPTDYGGSLATGHPFWVTDDKFLLLDRANRKIDLFEVSKGTEAYHVDFMNSINVNSSVHHVLGIPNAQGNERYLFYAISEGAPAEGIPPSITKFEVTSNGLESKSSITLPTTGVNITDMGSHHASFHPDGEHIYLGSNEGFTYVVNRKSMSVVKSIQTGLGNGHTTMIPGRMQGVSTNHVDTFMTIIDLNTHEAIKNIKVSDLAPASRKTQGHTSSFDPTNDRYFYTTASNEGRFIEIDLEKLLVSRENVELKDANSYLIQGVFIWE